MADSTIIEFITALRSNNVRVSTSESIDAVNAVSLIGYEDRALLKMALSNVIPKTEQDSLTFDHCFDQFFSFNAFTKDDASDAEGSSHLEQPNTANNANNDTPLNIFKSIAESLKGLLNKPQDSLAGNNSAAEQSSEPPEGDHESNSEGAGSGSQSGSGASASQLGQMLLSDDRSSLVNAMASAAKKIKLQQIQVITQKGLFGRRLMLQMGLEDLEAEIHSLEKSTHLSDHQLARKLTTKRNQLRSETKDFIEQQYLLFVAEKGEMLREETMKKVNLAHLREYKNAKLLIRKMAKKLISTHSRRRKAKQRGMLDTRKTIIGNIPNDGIMFNTHWKTKRIDRPKVITICDVSGSVSTVSRFLLMFLYSLSDVLPSVRAFVFSAELTEVTKLFEEHELEEATDITLDKHGMSGTSYGTAFEQFKDLCLNDIDNKTTIIILGDARNSKADPRADILKEIYKRAKQVIWINPEHKNRWGSGDSEMRSFTPYCTFAEVGYSLTHIERIINRVLRGAS